MNESIKIVSLSWHCPHCGKYEENHKVNVEPKHFFWRCNRNTDCSKTYVVSFSLSVTAWTGKIDWQEPTD